jgi:hypothetical protein
VDQTLVYRRVDDRNGRSKRSLSRFEISRVDRKQHFFDESAQTAAHGGIMGAMLLGLNGAFFC